MNDEELSFWDHLHELRRYLIRSVIVFFAFFILAFSFKDILFDHFLFRLLDSNFITYRWFSDFAKFLSVNNGEKISLDFHLININLAGQFIAHISISAVAALILTLPFLIFQLWLFIKPALYANERKIISKNAFVVVLLFVIGCAFAYFIITPLSVLFLGNYVVSSKVSNTISLSSYVSVFNSTLLLTGLLFELPVMVFILNKIGLIKADFMRKYRKHAIVVVLIVSAIITPTTDPFTMTIVAIPIYLLYEISIVTIAKKEKYNGSKNQT